MHIRFNSRQYPPYTPITSPNNPALPKQNNTVSTHKSTCSTPKQRVLPNSPQTKAICTEKKLTQPKPISKSPVKVPEGTALDIKKPILKLSFCSLYLEDLMLLALILVLMNEGCNEILLLALVYIFISGLEK